MDDTRFAHFYATRKLVHAGNYLEVLKWAESVPTEFVALDLETTTSEESDAWLAERRSRDSETGIDVLGSEIVSCGITFGMNCQHTLYFTHRHDPGDGIEQLSLAQLRLGIERMTKGRRVVCHNASGFELPVLGRHFREAWKDNGWGGFLPDVQCTRILANYVDENISAGLKSCAKHYFDYDQQTYMEVTGGAKMDQLTATHTFKYGADDPWVTAGLYNHLSFRCQLEGAWTAYERVEQFPMYLMADAFLAGVPFSMQRMRELEVEDDRAYEAAWATVRQYLIEQGWEGTTCPTYTPEIDAKQIKEAFQICTGQELQTQVRTPAKLLALIEAEDGDEVFTSAVRCCLDGDASFLNRLVATHFRGEPDFQVGSIKQMAHLMYGVMGLPIRLRGDLTDTMIQKGTTEGNPKTNELAIQMALTFDDGGPRPDVLKALLAMKTVETRRNLFYVPYRHVTHWTTGDRIHASFNQCSTVTRRYSCSGPNLQQLPKKGEGVKFREVLLPHKRHGAVVVSMDFSGQELRLMADDSQDPVMLSCYVGDQLRDLHSITGAGISKTLLKRKLTYEELEAALEAKDPDAKYLRSMGKKLNFTVQYGAQAKKIAETLLIEEDVAEKMLEGRAKTFAVSEEWKKDYIKETKQVGYAATRLGARRHLRDALRERDKRISSKAERQGPNFRIQGSAAEMTKLAMARMWETRLFERFDAVPYGPVHDEFVASVAISDLPGFLQEMHACMTQPYGGMRVPILSSISFGPDFGRQIEIGEEPTNEAVSAGLVALAEMVGGVLSHAA